MEKRVLQMAVLAVLVLLLSPSVVSATTYYVRTDGSNGNTGLANTASGAWLTIDFAADNVAAGDTIRVQAGTYAEAVSPSDAGTSGSPITFIADGAVTFCVLAISDGDNYLRFIGFTIDTDAGGCVKAQRAVALANGGTTTGVEFWNNTIRNATICAICSGSNATRNHNWIVIGNRFTALGANLGDGDGSSSGSAVGLRGNHNIIAYNTVTLSDPDEFYPDGTYSYWLNNYVEKHVTDGGHGDVFQTNSSASGLSFNTYEANFLVGDGDVSDEHGALLQDQGTSSCTGGVCAPITENLFRRNVWHNFAGSHLSADTSVTVGIFNTRNVHDTIVETMRTSPSTTYSALLRQDNTGHSFNNINVDAWTPGVNINIRAFAADTGASWLTAGYNLAHGAGATLVFASPWTTQTSPQNNVNPQFVDRANDNFTLRAGSGAIGAAGPLTTTSGIGTGTTFSVVTGGGGFFRGPNSNIAQYGGKLTEGDVITIGTDTRTVASVSGDRITVTSPFTWADGEPVYYGNDTTPDIGAYPYKPGGYALSASYAMAGSTATITPNDASLVRFVACYSDGVPYAVDNSTPYTCAAPAGTFSARVYSRYASKTLWVTVGVGPSVPTTPTAPSAPKNLKVTGH